MSDETRARARRRNRATCRCSLTARRSISLPGLHISYHEKQAMSAARYLQSKIAAKLGQPCMLGGTILPETDEELEASMARCLDFSVST